MHDALAGSSGAQPSKRSIGRWICYWAIAFVCLTIFYGALWFPITDWAISGINFSNFVWLFGLSVVELLGFVVRVFFYLLTFLMPAMFTVFGMVESAEAAAAAPAHPVAKAPNLSGTISDDTATTAEEKPADPLSGWAVLVIVLLVPGLIALYGAGREFQRFLSMCLWSSDCTVYLADWGIG